MPYFTLARVMLSVLLILAQLGTSIIYAMPVPAGPVDRPIRPHRARPIRAKPFLLIPGPDAFSGGSAIGT